MLMNSCEFVHFISSLACVIAQSTTEDELSILATFFTQLGDTLATISATRLDTKPSSCSNTDFDANTDADSDVDADTDKNTNTNTTDSNICRF